MKKYIYGIDVGGTSVKIGLFTVQGELVDKWSIKTDKSEKGKQVLHDIYNSIKNREVSLTEILGYGFGVPGPVADEIVFECVNIGWKNFDIKKEFGKLVHSDSIYVANDANAATLGETWKGAGKGYGDCAMLTLGTGVGGGIVSNSQIVSGGLGAAGEIGHLKVEFKDPAPCNCGGAGCLETYASATGIKRLYTKYMTESGIDMTDISPSAKTVMDLAQEGDEISVKTMNDVYHYLGYACHVLSVISNPDVIILGGGISRAGQYLLDNVYYHFNEYLYAPVKNTKIVLAELGNDAGIYGAAAMVVKHD